MKLRYLSIDNRNASIRARRLFRRVQQRQCFVSQFHNATNNTFVGTAMHDDTLANGRCATFIPQNCLRNAREIISRDDCHSCRLPIVTRLTSRPSSPFISQDMNTYFGEKKKNQKKFQSLFERICALTKQSFIAYLYTL